MELINIKETDLTETMDDFTDGTEDVPLEPPLTLQAIRDDPSSGCRCTCNYNVPTIRELWARDKRLLRAIVCIVVLLNVSLGLGGFVLYPFVLFSTWIHESFHGLAALSIGGKCLWLKIYPDGSGLAYTTTIIPLLSKFGKFKQAWVYCAGYQGTALTGGIMLMFRRTNLGARVGTSTLGVAMLLSCIFLVRNPFGLGAVMSMGTLLLLAAWRLPPFWVGELYALLAATTCLNAIASIRVLFFVTGATIEGTLRSSDAMAMQNLTGIPSTLWALMWLLFSFWMTAMGVFITVEPNENDGELLRQPLLI